MGRYHKKLMALATWLLSHGALLLPLTNQPIPTCTALGPEPRKLLGHELPRVAMTRPRTPVLSGVAMRHQDTTCDIRLAGPLMVVRIRLAADVLSRAARNRQAPTRDSLLVRSRQGPSGPCPRQSFCHESSRVLRTRPAPVVQPGVVRDSQDT